MTGNGRAPFATQKHRFHPSKHIISLAETIAFKNKKDGITKSKKSYQLKNKQYL